MQVGHRIVLIHICGNRRIHAYVSCTASGSRRLFFSTVAPSALHMSCAWQERKILRDAPAEGIDLLSFEDVQATLGHRNQLLWAEDLLVAECLPDSPPKWHWTHGESGRPRSQQPENDAVSGRAFCKVPKCQPTRFVKPYKLANTAWNIFGHFGL